MYKIIFYVPESHLECVKNAMFTQGAGRIGHYDCCAWQTKGQGQFRPQEGSKPFSGSVDNLSYVDEFKVEMICSDTSIKPAIEALIASHPYETPAFQYWPIEINTP